MPSDMIPLFAGDTKFINHLHLYKDDNPTEDALVICDTQNKILYCVMDRINFKIVERISFPYATKIINLLSEAYPHITRESMSLYKIMGLYDKSTTIWALSTMYFVIEVASLQEKHVVQVNIKNHDTKNAEFLLVPGHQRTKYIYMDMLVKKQVLINDTSSLTDIDVFLMYIKSTDPEDVSNMYVEGLRILVRQEEKAEFLANNADRMDIEFPDTHFPVADTWTEQQVKFFQLTEDTSRVKFNFSTGLGFLEFLDEEGV